MTKILAGGTDLLVQMRTDLIEPDLIVDIKGIDEVRSISPRAADIASALLSTGAELEEHATLKNDWPGVVEGTNLIGSTQIQGRATMGGNLCNGSPAADSVPGLIAAGAIATVAGPNGKSRCSRQGCHDRPAQAGDCCRRVRRFVLAAGAQHHIRRMPTCASSRAPKWTSLSSAQASISRPTDPARSLLQQSALGAVAPTPLLVDAAGAALVGTSLDKSALEALDAAAQAACNPIDDKRGTIEYRTKVAGVIARRTAEIAYERARSK